MTPPTTTDLSRLEGMLAPLLAGPWAISQARFATLRAHLGALLAAGDGPSAFFELSDFITPRRAMSIDDQGVASVHVQGALADGAPPIWEKLGQTDYRSIRAEIAAAQAAGATDLYLLIDSPGGTVAGVEESSAAIMSAADSMPVTAHVDGLCCSAAYWLAAGADEITATPSSEVGNVGVVLTFLDGTGFLSALGIEVEVLTNAGADLKGTFRESLTDSQRAFLQEDLDLTGAAFHSHVFGNRPQLDQEIKRAGWYSGQRALDLGLVDTLTTP